MQMPKVVAELGQCRGSFDYAVEGLEAAHNAGCWGAKIQLLQPETIAQPAAPVYWTERRPAITDQRANFAATGCLDYGEVKALAEVADEIGIELIATPFDEDAVEAMSGAGLTYCKIASGDITNERLVWLAAQAFPGRLVVSTGASTPAEISRCLVWIDMASQHMPWALLACSLVYPTDDEHAEIGRVRTLREKLLLQQDVLVGYSDHTRGTRSALVAVGAGAQVLEKHFTLDSSDPSVPDNAFALDRQDMAAYVVAAEHTAEMLGSGELTATTAEAPAWAGARRSICAARDLPAGHMVHAEDVIMLRPWRPDAFSGSEMLLVLDRRTSEAIPAGAPLKLEATY